MNPEYIADRIVSDALLHYDLVAGHIRGEATKGRPDDDTGTV